MSANVGSSITDSGNDDFMGITKEIKNTTARQIKSLRNKFESEIKMLKKE